MKEKDRKAKHQRVIRRIAPELQKLSGESQILLWFLICEAFPYLTEEAAFIQFATDCAHLIPSPKTLDDILEGINDEAK